ncbi:hypothetical protein [Gordonia bronchialis]|uniref:hypothetical protein n=1 Tax=Gordonia bronchialis TaxID=2054 RepID=UPI001CBBF661|nr:hypothetical protein [Gordonia bronchialis]
MTGRAGQDHPDDGHGGQHADDHARTQPPPARGCASRHVALPGSFSPRYPAAIRMSFGQRSAVAELIG